MGDHWRKVWEIVQILVGNFLVLLVWVGLMTAMGMVLEVFGGPKGPMFFGYFPAKNIIDAGELIGLVALVIVSIADLWRVLWR